MILLPILIIGLTVALSVPLGRYMARVLDRAGPSNAIERLIDTGGQNWKQYVSAMLLSNAALFAFGFVVLATQPWHPAFLNPDNKGMLSPFTIFNTACSFLTNTNLQHYSGEVHLTYGSQIFGIMYKQFMTPAIGLAALLAVIRGLRGDKTDGAAEQAGSSPAIIVGNYNLDVWRGLVYVALPLSVVVGLLLIAGGTPMTFRGNQDVPTLQVGALGTTDDGSAKPQTIARGPVAAVVAIKQLGTNGGGFFGPNSAHPLENPTAWTNVIECVCITLIPMACLVMFGHMIRNRRHAGVIFGVSLLILIALTSWGLHHDTAKPNPGLAGGPAILDAKGQPPTVTTLNSEGGIEQKPLPDHATRERVGLPVTQDTGNLEGKELRFGPGAGPTWAAVTTCTSNGSVNCMHDSLNPLAGLAPLTGMWLNCAFGGIGVGLINMLIYFVVAVFLAGLMVGRTPEYLGKKVEAREMKLAALALLAHPILILAPLGLFAAAGWLDPSTNNPGAHGFGEGVYEFTSSSANNGSGFEGLGDTFGFSDADKNASAPAPYAPHWDIACGLVMILARFIPIIAPIAFAASLGGKKPTPFTSGTLRTDTVTFGCVLLGTILLVGALMFLPIAALGPVAEHFGPLPFGR
ncbi:potassium-transporting ATPase subunit KdpA [Gemmata sp. JC717]|uniref:potassium-transporting ATPase subunit KdpA n=1 Tax=Gemmata algarum TaxID=2975278 RepID=UPI0021BAF596|nr:potassium-transporting ATPase subunit KdpA [Gemmata algarum]MDY3551534.1 potassium-transporting ATPase subunit KdpA [Gemmata algarum]